MAALGPPDAEDVWFNALHGDVEEMEAALKEAPAGSVDRGFGSVQ